MEPRLLDLLVCPLCKGPLKRLYPPQHTTEELICLHDRLAFPVREGIPVMLIHEARHLDPNETETACQAWGVEHENQPLPDLQAHHGAMGPKNLEKGAAPADFPPTTPRPDRLPDSETGPPT